MWWSDFTKPIVFMYKKLFKQSPTVVPVNIALIPEEHRGAAILEHFGMIVIDRASSASTISTQNSTPVSTP